MLKFYHAPKSRSGRVHWLLHELDVPFETCRMDIPRQDGSGARDPRNPHLDGKVPAIEGRRREVPHGWSGSAHSSSHMPMQF